MKGTTTIRINSEPPKLTTFEDLGYVQVVQCKDCIHRGKSEKCVLAAISEEKDFPIFMLDNRGEWYCADGERNNGRTNEQKTVCPEIEGDRHTWFYVCGDCHGQVNWHDPVCRHCKVRLNWNG